MTNRACAQRSKSGSWESLRGGPVVWSSVTSPAAALGPGRLGSSVVGLGKAGASVAIGRFGVPGVMEKPSQPAFKVHSLRSYVPIRVIKSSENTLES